MDASTSTPLLDRMPAEMRNMIWENTLLEDEPIDILHEREHRPLLDSCRQIRAEASQLYYQRNTFAFEITTNDKDTALDPLVDWLTIVGPTRCKYLRHIQISITDTSGALIKNAFEGSDPWTALVAHIQASGAWACELKLSISTTWKFGASCRNLFTSTLSDDVIEHHAGLMRRELRKFLQSYVSILCMEPSRLKEWKSESSGWRVQDLLFSIREAILNIDQLRAWNGRRWPPFDVAFDYAEVEAGVKELVQWVEARPKLHGQCTKEGVVMTDQNCKIRSEHRN